MERIEESPGDLSGLLPSPGVRRGPLSDDLPEVEPASILEWLTRCSDLKPSNGMSWTRHRRDVAGLPGRAPRGNGDRSPPLESSQTPKFALSLETLGDTKL